MMSIRMKPDNGRIVFFDTEVNPQTGAVTDIGAADGAGRTFHSPSKNAFRDFLRDADFVCGHNVIRHDLNFVGDCLPPSAAVIDTLPLSPLLFPRRPYHKLLKDDKLLSEELKSRCRRTRPGPRSKAAPSSRCFRRAAASRSPFRFPR